MRNWQRKKATRPTKQTMTITNFALLIQKTNVTSITFSGNFHTLVKPRRSMYSTCTVVNKLFLRSDWMKRFRNFLPVIRWHASKLFIINSKRMRISRILECRTSQIYSTGLFLLEHCSFKFRRLLYWCYGVISYKRQAYTSNAIHSNLLRNLPLYCIFWDITAVIFNSRFLIFIYISLLHEFRWYKKYFIHNLNGINGSILCKNIIFPRLFFVLVDTIQDIDIYTTVRSKCYLLRLKISSNKFFH